MLIFQKMLTLFLLMMVGFVFRRLKWINESNSSLLSKIVLNVANPAMMIAAGMDSETSLSNETLIAVFLTAVIFYALLLATAPLIMRLLRIPAHLRGTYQFMYVFGNIGFMGMPLITSVYGSEYALLVALFNFVFSVLMYTWGIARYRQEAAITAALSAAPEGAASAPGASGRAEDAGTSPGAGSRDEDAASEPGAVGTGTGAGAASPVRSSLRQMINPGTIGCVIAMICFLTKVPVPDFLYSAFDMCSNLAGPLSMFVIGSALAAMRPKELISDLRLNVFILVRLIVIPLVGVTIVNLIAPGEILQRVFYVMISVPIASTSVMMAQEYGGHIEVASRGVALSTLVSVLSLPLVGVLTGF